MRPNEIESDSCKRRGDGEGLIDKAPAKEVVQGDERDGEAVLFVRQLRELAIDC